MPDPDSPARVNRQVWERGSFVAEYANRRLLPVEVLLLVRHREALSGRVLELGCGAGRVLGYLVALGGEVHGIDISPTMVAHCRAAYPDADVEVGDLAALPASLDGEFSSILAMDNVLDVLDDAERRATLAELRARLADGGVLIFSSHNLQYVDSASRHQGQDGRGGETRSRLGGLLGRPPSDLPQLARRLPERIRNRRRLAPLQRRQPGYAILNDSAHDYSLLHYYMRAADQEQQLQEAGLELIECLDVDGRPIAPARGSDDPWLHYVARTAS